MSSRPIAWDRYHGARSGIAVQVLLDHGPDRRSEIIPCSLVRHWFDGAEIYLAIVQEPNGKELQVQYSQLTRVWRPVRPIKQTEG